MQLILALAADKATLEEQLLERTRSLEACVATVEAQHQELLAAVVTVKAESQQRLERERALEAGVVTVEAESLELLAAMATLEEGLLRRVAALAGTVQVEQDRREAAAQRAVDLEKQVVELQQYAPVKTWKAAADAAAKYTHRSELPGHLVGFLVSQLVNLLPWLCEAAWSNLKEYCRRELAKFGSALWLADGALGVFSFLLELVVWILSLVSHCAFYLPGFETAATGFWTVARYGGELGTGFCYFLICDAFSRVRSKRPSYYGIFCVLGLNT